MKDNSPGSTIARAFTVIECVAGSPGPVALPDIVEATGFPKSTVHWLLQLLEAESMLAREPGRKHYVAGLRLGALALAALKNSSVRAEKIGTDDNEFLHRTYRPGRTGAGCQTAHPRDRRRAYADLAHECREGAYVEAERLFASHACV